MKMDQLYARYESIIPDFDLFMQYLKKPLVQSLRINTLKGTRTKTLSLLKDIELRQLSFYRDGFRVIGRVSIGNHMTHGLGLIYVQEAASMLPALLLDPQPDEVVLDMCAAPGSKTTQIAQMMVNRGLLVANETSRKRMRGLIHNIKRCGLLNEVVICIGGQKAHRIFNDYFDRVLIDAPCSAEGTVRRSKAVLYHWGTKNIMRMSRIQIGLVLSGFRALRPGGTMIYSTCTIAPEENEAVISYLLEKFPEAELMPVTWEHFKMRPGITTWQGTTFDRRVKNCARILPQDNDTAPFFIAKVTKRGVYRPRVDYLGRIEVDSNLLSGCADRFGISPEQFQSHAIFRYRDENFISTPEVFSFTEVNALRKGLEFGRLYDHVLKPDNDLIQIFGSQATRNTVDLKAWQFRQFLKGAIVKIGAAPHAEKGFIIVRYNGLPMGVGRYNGTELKSAIIRERRIP